MAIIILNIQVEDLDAVLGLFNRIEVFRSPTELGTYELITAETPTAAKLIGSVAGPWALNSLILTVEKNGAEPKNVTFTGTNPIDLATIISQVNAVLPGLASESAVGSGKIALTSDITGTGSSLLISGTAAAVLGLSVTKVNGLGPRMVLMSPTTEYAFTDFDGVETSFYKTRYFSTITGAVSVFSDPMQGSIDEILAAAQLIKAKLNLADVGGRAVAGRRVVFTAQEPRLNIPGTAPAYSVLPGFDRLIAITDNRGLVEVDLVRGMKVTVFIEGTSFQREFVVPVDPLLTEFDVLAIAGTQPDPFAIVQAPPMPIRSS